MITTTTGLRRTLAATVGTAIALSVALTGCSSTPATTASTPAAAPLPATPRLASADNFRDIGGIGAGYVTSDGKHVKRGVVYRSNALTLKPADVATVQSLGVTEILDLRTPGEIAAKPDAEITGAEWVNENVIGASDAGMPTFKTPQEATAMMATTYRNFVSDETARKAIAATLTEIADSKGADIVHCTAGKDRTGWVSAVLLSVAGVPQKTITNDYLLTNQYSRSSINATLAGLKAQGGDAAAAVYAPLLGVDASYLDATFDQLKSDYGTMDSYLTKGLGLSKKTIAKLKDRLVA
ncbi:tyrosine-protein phosphatase [Rathayibacter sp. YIM 133350]|uniref:tyrosine-protein phosphatase n=1 Tax=Rathayibacter sp. YIM 133350 TaxID=3131992 RepID=UPI00307FAF0F